MSGVHTRAADLARGVARRHDRRVLIAEAAGLLDALEVLPPDDAARVLVNALDFTATVTLRPELAPWVPKGRGGPGPRELLRPIDEGSR